jgi:rhomboid protease GluP
MLGRKTSGSVVCASCGSLVGVNDDRCYSCGRATPGMWGFAPAIRSLGNDLGFAPLVIGGSVVLYLLCLLVSGPAALQSGGLLNFLAPTEAALVTFGASGAGPLFRGGYWWTLLSATWLHGSLLHILFNMMWVRDIGPAMVKIIGPGRTVSIYVVSGACGFLLSSLAGQYFPPISLLLFTISGARGITVGASASIFGLLGALVHYGRKSGSSMIHGQAKQWAIIMFAYGLLMPGGGVDNFAHAGGFLGGYLMSSFFNPLTRERGDHMLVAGLCLLASLAAVVISVAKNWIYLSL